MSWAVNDGHTMELTLASLWSTPTAIHCDITLFFRGIKPSIPQLCITNGCRVSDMIRVDSLLANVELSPAGKLNKWYQVVKPVGHGKVSPLSVQRDGIPIHVTNMATTTSNCSSNSDNRYGDNNNIGYIRLYDTSKISNGHDVAPPSCVPIYQLIIEYEADVIEITLR